MERTPVEILLFDAVERRDVDSAREIMNDFSRTINIEVGNGYNITPLFCAADGDDFDMVKLLLDYGADIETSDGSPDTPLTLALANGNVEMIKELVKRGADTTYIDLDRYTSGGISSKEKELLRKMFNEVEMKCLR